MSLPSEKKSQEVQRETIKTPQELVHIRHRISLRQYKYWTLMLRKYREAYEEGHITSDSSDMLRINEIELRGFMNYMPSRNELRADLEALRIEPIIYNVLEKDGQPVQYGAGFISEWSASSHGIGFKLPTFLKKSVEQLDLKNSMFHALVWNIFDSFSGKYEALLYKLCKDYVGVGRTPYMELKAYRDYMGVDEDEYTDFKRLSQWVISGPIKKINSNEISDIEVDVEYRRSSGRKVIGLQFLVKAKRQTLLDFGDDPAFREARITVSIPQQQKYLKSKPAAAIELAIRRANQYADEKEAKGETVDLGAVYRTAIKEDWGLEFEAKQKQKAERDLKRQQAADAKRVKEEREAEAKAEVTSRVREERAAAMSAYNALPEDQRVALWDAFVAQAKAHSMLAREKGMASRIIKELFQTWLLEHSDNGN